jgi:hypothetical protein
MAMDDTAASAREGADAFDRLELSARQAGRSMQAAFAAAGAEGRKLEDVLRAVGTRLGDMAVQSAGRAGSSLLNGGLSQALTSIASGGLTGGEGSASASSAAAAPAAQAARPVSVIMNVSTPDAESFRRGEAQVSAALARAVARGNRAM